MRRAEDLAHIGGDISSPAVDCDRLRMINSGDSVYLYIHILLLNGGLYSNLTFQL